MKIKEVEKQLSISSHALRYYEKMNLIHPQRDENGYRDYNMQDIERLKKIRFLRELEIPIEDISKFKDSLTEETDIELYNIVEEFIQSNIPEYDFKQFQLKEKG